MFYIDPIYIIIMIPALALSLFAQYKVKHAFKKYSKVRPSSNLSGAEASRKLLEQNGLYDVVVEKHKGNLNDHYDPRHKVLRLSPQVHDGRSLAALGVAAHETGHALQDANNYVPMKLRSGLVPVASFGSKMAMPLFFIGILLVGWMQSPIGYLLMNIAILAFTIAVIFQLITLPVEFNASGRAMHMLTDGGLISDSEYKQTRAILNAAALTYIAAAASAVLTLLYLILRSRR